MNSRDFFDKVALMRRLQNLKLVRSITGRF